MNALDNIQGPFLLVFPRCRERIYLYNQSSREHYHTGMSTSLARSAAVLDCRNAASGDGSIERPFNMSRFNIRNPRAPVHYVYRKRRRVAANFPVMSKGGDNLAMNSAG
jgi:hypothetical protein